AELGLISDRNFLEQYFEWDWDQKKDATTGFELKRATDNMSYSLTADVRVNSTPTDPQDLANFQLLPWEANTQGERFVTRQEVDLPVQLGPVKVVPYAEGELAHWGEDLN